MDTQRPLVQRNKEISHSNSAIERATMGIDKKMANSKNLLPFVGIPGQTFEALCFLLDITISIL
jgi:hypothetical protein